jgi:uncharacterized Tic20 family protein
VNSAARGSSLAPADPWLRNTSVHTSLRGEQYMSDVPQDQKTMAMLSRVLGIFTCFVGPLIIWLINKDKPDAAFVNDQAKEALNFQITMAIGYVASSVLMIIIIGFLTYIAFALASLILSIMAAMKANEGIEYRYPFALRLIK